MPGQDKRPSVHFVESPEFNNLVLMCQTFGQRPSVVARELLGNEVPPLVSARDWYVFDVTAAAQYHALIHHAQTDAPVLSESANGETTIRGTEIPPWER